MEKPKIPIDDLSEDLIQKVLDVWVEVGGNDPSVSPAEILERIHQANTGDQGAQYKLQDGYRFESSVGSSKLMIRVLRDKIEFSCNDNAPAMFQEEGDKMRSEFAEQLKDVLG